MYSMKTPIQKDKNCVKTNILELHIHSQQNNKIKMIKCINILVIAISYIENYIDIIIHVLNVWINVIIRDFFHCVV